jgi:murein DD-endopeptidase MepM/ murein hydrolase activator NlpD
LRSLSHGGALAERRRLGRATTTLAVLVALGAIGIGSVAPAAADSGGVGVQPPPEGNKKSKTKLLPTRAKPARVARLADVRCAANPGGPCLDAHRAERGATLQLRGRNLSTARQIVFYGGRGAADDALAAVSAPQATRAVTTVPAQALTGPVAVIDSSGKRSPRWDGLIVDIPQSFTFRPASAVPGVQVGLSQPRTIFFGGMQKAIFNFQVAGTRPLDVRIDLVRRTDGIIVQSWQRSGASPGVTQRITWNGAVRGRPQPQGRYAFRVTVPAAVGGRAEPPPPDDRDAITLMGYVFPISGPHRFGMGVGRFGAARSGHRHQGQDTFARCGTPLVAARGGKVIYAGYQSLAGYYVAIDGTGTGVDYMYAHLRQPALVATGDDVFTGQQIGEVGDTGDAVGCHLHFEEWTAPGWYKGGHPFDPLPDLKQWDAGPALS